MKKIQVMMLSALVAFGMTSCSVSDNAVVELPEVIDGGSAEAVAGEYNGYTSASAAYFSGMISENDKVVVTANNDNTVDLTYTSTTWGVATFKGVEVALANGVLTLAEAEGTIAMASHGGETKEYACLLTEASIAVSKSAYTFVFNAPAVMGGTTMTFVEGEAPVALLVAGTYKGWTSAASAYFEGMNTDGDQVEITANEDETVKVVYTSETWGVATFDAVKVNRTDEGFAVAEEVEGVVLMPGMNGGEAKEYAIILKSGELTKNNREFTFEFNAPAVMGGTTLTFQAGEAPAAEPAVEDGTEEGEGGENAEEGEGETEGETEGEAA